MASCKQTKTRKEVNNVKRYEVELYFAGRLLGYAPQEEVFHYGFIQDEQGFYFKARYFRALMKDYARALDIEGLRARVQASTFVEPAKIYLGKSSPDGSLTRIVRLVCAGCKGPRDIVQTNDYVENQTMRFQVTSDIDEEVLRKLFDCGSQMSKGREFNHYEFKKLELIEEVNNVEKV